MTFFEASSRSIFLFARDPFGKRLHTVPDLAPDKKKGPLE
jgi:hypothetical protein